MRFFFEDFRWNFRLTLKALKFNILYLGMDIRRIINLNEFIGKQQIKENHVLQLQ